MLSIWIGRAGSGKSEKVLRTIAAERTRRAQVLIVPEHTSHRAEVDLCRACGETASRNAEVLSFQNLATSVLSRTGGLVDVTLERTAQGVPPPVPARGVSAAAGGAGGGVLRL